MICISCARDRLAKRPKWVSCDQCAAVNPAPLHVRAARAAAPRGLMAELQEHQKHLDTFRSMSYNNDVTGSRVVYPGA